MDDVTAILERLRALESKVDLLSRSAPGRGNVWLGDNLVLTRLSMPDMFYGDPIFVVTADDWAIGPRLMMDGAYEKNATYYVCRRVQNAKLCIDVGANIGYYTVVMARHAPQATILSLEPNEITFRLLQRNIVMNQLANCRPTMKGASARADQLPFASDPTYHVSAAVIDPRQIDVMRKTHSVQTAQFVPLDELTAPFDHRCDFIKIDVEGYEPNVFAGMTKTLAHNPDLSIMMEWSPGQIEAAGLDPKAFCRTLQAMNFRLFTIGELGVLAEVPISALAGLPYQNVVLERG